MCRQHFVHDLVGRSGWQHLTCILGDELSSASMTCLIISVARLVGWNPTYRFLTFLTAVHCLLARCTAAKSAVHVVWPRDALAVIAAPQ